MGETSEKGGEKRFRCSLPILPSKNKLPHTGFSLPLKKAIEHIYPTCFFFLFFISCLLRFATLYHCPSTSPLRRPPRPPAPRLFPPVCCTYKASSGTWRRRSFLCAELTGAVASGAEAAVRWVYLTTASLLGAGLVDFFQGASILRRGGC